MFALVSCKSEAGNAAASDLQSGLDAANTRLTALEQGKTEMQSALESFKASLAEVPAAAQSVPAFTDLQTGIDGMLGKWSRVQEEIDAVRTALQDASAKISAAKSEAEIQQAREALDAALKQLDNSDTNIKTYEDALQQMKATLGGLSM